MRRRLRVGLACGVLVTLLLAAALPANAQAINDPTSFWNALKVALGGGAASVVNGGVRWVVSGFVGGGWVVAGATVLGLVGVYAYNRWKAAHTTSADWETFSSGMWGQFYWNTSLACGWTGYSWRYQISSNPDDGVAYGTGIHAGFGSQADCRSHLNSNAPGWYAAWRSWVQNNSAYNPPAGPTGGTFWPGTQVQVPTTLAEAVADARWSTIESQVAAELPAALEDRRAELGGAYPARLENYAGTGAYDTTFSNPQAVSQPGNSAVPQPGDPNAPATASYLRDLISWLADVWRTQVAWLAGIIETWEGRVVTELQGVKEAVVALPATIGTAVETGVTTAVDTAFTPSQASVDALKSIPVTLQTKFPFSIPSALQSAVPQSLPNDCVGGAPSWTFALGAMGVSNSVTISMAPLCAASPTVRPIGVWMWWIYVTMGVVKWTWPRLSA